MSNLTTNTLYPVFFKLSKLKMLIVGAGQVAQEKLHFILKSSPDAQVTVIAPEIAPEIIDLFNSSSFHINIINKEFYEEVLDSFDLVVAATNIKSLNQQVYAAAKLKKVLINVADTPELCDFYMGSIVTKGDLKIAISTNGKSPTFAKRFRQLLEQILPDNIEELLPNLQQLRNKLQLSFSEKVSYLNEVTKSLIEQNK
ncbi:MAG: bifunctional precorrin-2 dehydrogenase/sirohydrochlorin ferrochelatase [Saprospiraceae bacterium]|nr:bifunctional precorrin-2 dehydrogenase/sirohydrochlorin ferrochelatase [Saprospiraceae bacterium]